MELHASPSGQAGRNNTPPKTASHGPTGAIFACHRHFASTAGSHETQNGKMFNTVVASDLYLALHDLARVPRSIAVHLACSHDGNNSMRGIAVVLRNRPADIDACCSGAADVWAGQQSGAAVQPGPSSAGQ